jgi:hypothetical protein
VKCWLIGGAGAGVGVGGRFLRLFERRILQAGCVRFAE